MKRFFSAILVLFMLASSIGAVDLYVDSTLLETDTPAQLVNGRTLVPLRAIFDALGAEVTWDASTWTAYGVKDDTHVSIQINNPVAYVNKQAISLDVPAQMINNRTMVPARFISESLGAKVYWDPSTSTVRIATQVYDVVRVIDGDTIVVDFHGIEETVRFIGVDSPESVSPNPSENCEKGFAASAYTKEMLTGAEVELEFDAQQRDQYGRLLAYVYLNGVMYNNQLVKEGYADAAEYPPNTKYANLFRETQAKRDADLNESVVPDTPAEPEETESEPSIKTEGTYVGSIDSNKYHIPSCRHAKKIIPENEIWFDTESEAQSAGYIPCGVCKP